MCVEQICVFVLVVVGGVVGGVVGIVLVVKTFVQSKRRTVVVCRGRGLYVGGRTFGSARVGLWVEIERLVFVVAAVVAVVVVVVGSGRGIVFA